MRYKLKNMGRNRRHFFTAKVGRISYEIAHKNYGHPTILLVEIRHKGKVVAGHIWFEYTPEFQKLANKSLLVLGDTIQFEGRVFPYYKGRHGPYSNISQYIR